MMKLICLSFLLVAILTICPNPQKSIFLSFKSLSNLDHLSQMFNMISRKSQPLFYIYHDNQQDLSFLIHDLKYKLMYNNHFQREEYLDANTIKVTLGPVNVIAEMQVSITQQSTSTQIYGGKVIIKSFLDPAFFTKKIITQSGFVQWQPQTVPTFTFTFLWLLDGAQPYMLQSHRQILLRIVNGMVGDFQLTKQIQTQINRVYLSSLKTFLNSQKILSINNINYIYRDLAFIIEHRLQNIMIDKQNNGLKAYILFGVNNTVHNQTDCPTLPTSFDQKQFGGKQEIISFSTLKFIINQAIQRGLYKVKLDSSWQALAFQFYMGDLGNAVPAADYYSADSSFVINCQPSSLQSTNIFAFDESSVYVQIPQKCVLNFNSTDILAIDMDLILVAKLRAEQKYLSVKISSTQTRNVKYTPIDPKFTVQRTEVASMILQAVLGNLVNKSTFGEGLPILQRRYPSMILQSGYLLLFDPSQIYN